MQWPRPGGQIIGIGNCSTDFFASWFGRGRIGSVRKAGGILIGLELVWKSGIGDGGKGSILAWTRPDVRRSRVTTIVIAESS